MLVRHRMAIDGFGCKKFYHYFSSYKDLVTTLAQTLGVHEVQFQATEVEDLKEPKGQKGVSVSASFLESGLMLRTWPGEREASLDIFSCREFDRKLVLNVFRMFFEPERLEVR